MSQIDFDISAYKYYYNDPHSYLIYAEMTEELDFLLENCAPEDIQKLAQYRSPVSVAKMEYKNAIASGMEEGMALYTAVGAYEDRRDEFIVRSANDEVLFQCDQKRSRGEKLTKRELDEEMAAFLAKRGDL